jgi:hypothetical protein
MVMGCYIGEIGYYEGDQLNNLDQSVPPRPAPNFEWTEGQWKVNPPSVLDYDIAIERHLDAEAEAAGYYDPLGRIPNIDRACSYAGYVNQYQAESQSFVAWRAAVWAHAFQVKSDVEANVRAQPTIEELIAELPARVIPE